MSAYVIVEVDIKDPARYEEYKKLALPAVKLYGGKYLARGGRVEKLEGAQDPKRVVILEFESIERVKQWWNSDEYTPIKKIRHETAESRMIVLEGLDIPL